MGLLNNYVTRRGWVFSAFFVMFSDGKQGADWYLMKVRKVTVKQKS